MQIITEANVKVFILISWKHYQKVEGAPNDMTFYTAKPSKGSFVTLIGIGNEKVLIAGTQSSGNISTICSFGSSKRVRFT